MDSAIKVIQTDEFVQSAIDTPKYGRGLVPNKILQENPDLVKFLQSAVSRTFVSGDPETDKALDLCYRNGWLQAELLNDGSGVYIFPSTLHRR